MLFAEALRLAAIEVLCPTASIASDAGWPTLARDRVYDSVGIVPDQVNPGDAVTPYLSLHTEDVGVERRGESAPQGYGRATAVLKIVGELGVIEHDPDGTAFVAPAQSDADGSLKLGALCAQVRKALVFSEAGALFRSIGVVEDFRSERFSMPQFDLKLMRASMWFTCLVKDDVYSDLAGLPEPLAGLAARLPAGSYAKARLLSLADTFAATTRTPLDDIRFSTKTLPAGASAGEGNVNTSP